MPVVSMSHSLSFSTHPPWNCIPIHETSVSTISRYYPWIQSTVTTSHSSLHSYLTWRIRNGTGHCGRMSSQHLLYISFSTLLAMPLLQEDSNSRSRNHCLKQRGHLSCYATESTQAPLDLPMTLLVLHSVYSRSWSHHSYRTLRDTLQWSWIQHNTHYPDDL